MIVHVTGNVQHFQKSGPLIAKIVHVVKQDDCTLAYDHTKDLATGKTAVAAELEAINRADIIIIEASDYDFDQGMQTAAALQQKKPTLIVSQTSLEQTGLARYHNRLLTIATYNSDEELNKIVSRFIHANIISTKDLRFNMFIDRPIHNYLRNRAYETGKNKSEIIRELINKEINKER
jgi:hypothetical protein